MSIIPDASWFWSMPRIWPGETVVVLGGGESLTDEQVEHVRRRHAEGACKVIAINRAYVKAPWADMLFGADAGRFWSWCSGPNRLWGERDPDAIETFPGLKVSLWTHSPHGQHLHAPPAPRLVAAGVKLLQHPGEGWHTDLSGDPRFVRGNNSCQMLLSGPIPYSGAARTILLGIDMRGRHWHRDWPHPDLKFEAEEPPPRPGQEPTRCHRGAIRLLGREVEIGWFKSEGEARKVETALAQHIAWGCKPQPNLGMYGIIPLFVTLLEPLARLEHEVLNASPGSALKVFPQVQLENVL